MHCKNCKYWKNEQAETDYNKFIGICVSPELKFNIETGISASVLDRSKESKKFHKCHTFENVSAKVPVGEVQHSNYCLVTNEDFGCVNFTKKIK